jgi:hypothetical protein
MLSVLRLRSVNDKMINEYGIGGMRIYTGKRSTVERRLSESPQSRIASANKHHCWAFSNIVFENVNLLLCLLLFHVSHVCFF